MNRQDVLDFINDKLLDENAEYEIEEGQPLVESGVDSFGLTMTLVDIDNEYGLYTKDEFREINFAEITAREVIDSVMSKHGSN